MECVQADMRVPVMSAQVMNSREAGAAVVVSAHESVFANCAEERPSRCRRAGRNAVSSKRKRNGHSGICMLTMLCVERNCCERLGSQAEASAELRKMEYWLRVANVHCDRSS